MKVSPSWSVGMFEASIAVVERDLAVETVIELNFGAGEAEAAVLGRYLETAAFPLHDVVVAHDAFVKERTDAFEVGRGRAPGFGGIARGARKAAVVVGDELAEHPVGGVEIAGLRQAQFAGEAILQHTPEALDAAFGLRRLRSDEGDAEFGERAAELRGLAAAGELLFDRPVGVVTHEDAAAVSVQGQGEAKAAQQAVQQVQIACGGFGEEELGSEDFAVGVILHAESGEERAAAFQPVVRTAVELDEFSFAGGRQAALTMSGRAAFSGRAPAFLAQEAAQSFAAEGKAFDLVELFREMMVVEARIAGACQVQNA